MLCSICYNDIPSVGGWDSGNNAAPVNYGRCCDDCNGAVVIPARINMMRRRLPAEQFMEMQRVQFRGMCQVMAKGSDLALELADKSPEVAENTAAASGPSAE